MAITPMRHGIIMPNKMQNIPGRVINAKSKRKDNNTKIRLDRLLHTAEPKICIKRRLGGIGDVLMTTPLLKAIKKKIPRCQLTYATDLKYAQGSLADVIKHNPYVDILISSEEASKVKYDYCVDITATGLGKERPGTIPPNRIDMFAEEVGVDISEDPVPIYELEDKEIQWGKDLIKKCIPDFTKETIVVSLQTRSNDARRTWPLERVDKLIELLTKNRIHTFILDWGHTSSRWQNNQYVHTDIINTEGVWKTASILNQSDVVICPDSSILHLAGALNKKIVSIFGPIPPQSRINHYTNAIAITKNLPCQFCVANDSYILTQNGYKDIQNIQVGELVYTANGEFKEVIAIHKNNLGERKLHELSIFGTNENIVVTDNHKLLIANRKYSWKNKDRENKSKRKGIPIISKPEWKEAKDIKSGEYCCIPISQAEGNVTSKLLQSEDLAWLIGLFVAEGWTSIPHENKTSREYKMVLSINATEEEKVLSSIKSIIERYPEIFKSDRSNKGFVSCIKNTQGNSKLISISNKNFVQLLHQLFNIQDKKTINKAASKQIPYQILGASNSIIESFLSGLQYGDGYVADKEIVYSTASRELAYGIQLLHGKLGILSRIYKRTRNTNYKKNAIIYRVYKSKQVGYKRWYSDKKYFYVPVKSNKLSHRKDDIVFDITVKDDPTFTINNISAYDCWYSPKCIRDSEINRMSCLTTITAEEVMETIIKKLAEEHKVKQDILLGQDHTRHGQDNIIMIRRSTKGLGDILMATPAISTIKKIHPNIKIEIACDRTLWPALQNNPNIDKLVDINDSYNPKRYYAIIDISTPCARYESARVAAKKEVQKSRSEIYAEACGVLNKIESLIPEYFISNQEKEYAKEFMDTVIDKNKRSVMINVQSAELYRDWPTEHLDLLIKILSNKYNIILGSYNKNKQYENSIDINTLDIRKKIAILSQCDGLITVDTSWLHIGAALNKPTIALFGPIDYRPRCKGYKNVTVVQADMKCIPCWRNAHTKCNETGLIQGSSKCMSSIPAQRVASIAMAKFDKI